MRLSLLALSVCALMLAGCSGDPGAGRQAQRPSPTPSATAAPTRKPRDSVFSAAGKSLIESKKGRPWMMEVLKVVWNDSKQQARVENVDWTLSDPKGRKLLRVQAPAATYFPEANRIEFEGRVVAARYFAKDKIAVNHLVWEGKKNYFYGSKGVRWERGKVVVVGDRMNCPDSLEKIHVEGNVQAVGVVENL